MSKPIDEAYQASRQLLYDLATETGFIAASVDRNNYARIFSRDSMISGLAAIKTDDEYLMGTFLRSLETLRDTQHSTGRIVSNVSIDKKSLSFGRTVGRIDASLWYLIGVCQYYLKTKDKKFLDAFSESLEKVEKYLECLELNGRGLIYIPPGGDWVDEYIISGYALYDQMLHYIGLKSYLLINSSNNRLKKRVKRLKNLLRVNYFPYSANSDSKYVYQQKFFDLHAKAKRPNVPLSSFYQSIQVDGQVDNFGNALILASDVLKDKEKRALIQDITTRFLSINSSMLPAFSPVISEASPHWKFLQANNRFGFRNKPHQYHNGGQWPLIQGYFLASMSGDQAQTLLEKFAGRLGKDHYSFPEYYNGLTGEPGGVANIGFSAAGYIMAYEGIVNKQKLFIA